MGLPLLIGGAIGAYFVYRIAHPQDDCMDAPRGREARRDALRSLVRPDLVSHLIPDGVWPGFVCSVGRWLQHTSALGALVYRAEPARTDRWCRPDITLRRGYGDCEDLALVACSLLRAGGIEAHVVIGTLSDQRGTGGHAWVEGYDFDGAWFLLEATSGRVRWTGRPSAYTPVQYV